MNQITLNQLEELISLRLKSLGLENYDGVIEEVNDNIIRWLLKIRDRKMSSSY